MTEREGRREEERGTEKNTHRESEREGQPRGDRDPIPIPIGSLSQPGPPHGCQDGIARSADHQERQSCVPAPGRRCRGAGLRLSASASVSVCFCLSVSVCLFLSACLPACLSFSLSPLTVHRDGEEQEDKSFGIKNYPHGGIVWPEYDSSRLSRLFFAWYLLRSRAISLQCRPALHWSPVLF